MRRDYWMCALAFLLGALWYWAVFDWRIGTRGSINTEIKNAKERQFIVLGYNPDAQYIRQYWYGSRDPRGIYPAAEDAGNWIVVTYRSRDEYEAAVKAAKNSDCWLFPPKPPKEK